MTLLAILWGLAVSPIIVHAAIVNDNFNAQLDKTNLQVFNLASVKTKPAALAKTPSFLLPGSANLATIATITPLFNTYKTLYSKTYLDTTQETLALQNFRANMLEVGRINADKTLPFWAGGNEHCDLSFPEFTAKFLMQVDQPDPTSPPSPPASGGRKLMTEEDSIGYKRNLLSSANRDWRSSNRVTPIRNQGGCGSCWAFAATAAIESAYLIKTGLSPSCIRLSEQQLVNCVRGGGYSSKGCSGGYSDEAMNYVFSRNQTLNRIVPYTGTDGSCPTGLLQGTMSGEVVKLAGGASRVFPYFEPALVDAVDRQPTVFYFGVDDSFRLYAGGIYRSSSCPSKINHAMVLIGYQTTGSLGKYWIVKNSWGTTWGESGYARIAFSAGWFPFSEGMCGMYKYAYTPPLAFTYTGAITCSPPPFPPRPPPKLIINKFPNIFVNKVPLFVIAKKSPPPSRLIIDKTKIDTNIFNPFGGR